MLVFAETKAYAHNSQNQSYHNKAIHNPLCLIKKMKYKLIYFLILLLFNSCFVVKHKKNVVNIEERGDKNGQMKLDGYYYRVFEREAFPYYKNEFGGFTENKSEPYQQKLIKPIILNSNGTIRTFNYQSGLQENLDFDFEYNCGLSDLNSTKSSIEHFECKLNNDKNKYDVWGKGVFKVGDSNILIQYYINWIGEYYLREQKGKILTDSTFILTEQYDYKLDTTYQINEFYKFKKFKNKPDSINFITKHPKRFGRKNKA